LTPELREILEAKPAARIAEAVARMTTVTNVLPRDDGLRAFTGLYLAVTKAVEAEVRPGAFEDAPFVRWLDVVFANLYFQALRSAFAGNGSVPRAWAPLIEARRSRDILPLQFALAGMNAHINRDLPIALVKTCEQRRIELKSGTPQQRDFRKVNALLALVEDRVKTELVTDALSHVDLALGQVDDVLAMWNVERARDAAWVSAETLWTLRRLPELRADFEATLDQFVGFAGRGLLRPLAPRQRANGGGSNTE
jgi:hypothetical protein